MTDEAWHPAQIIADLLASALMEPLRNDWSDARSVYCWEREGLNYLRDLADRGERPPINAWTAMIVNEGYPAAKAGADQGKYWRPRND